MKAAIFNPYWDTLGGGELYCLYFAKVLMEKGYTVDIQWKDREILEKLEKRFGIATGGLRVVEDVKKGEGYDLCFWLSDGSIPLMHSRKNLIHFQFPFQGVGGSSLINKMKLYRVSKVICNSEFTKRFIDKEFKMKSVVIYPPVNLSDIKPKRKENIILYVGRFSQLTQKKNQDILIKIFKKFYDEGYKDWKLVLVGGVEVGSKKYLKDLEKLSEACPVEIIKSPARKVLVDLYGRAKFFWSAVGYGYDGFKHPMKVEHFGISLVEAMAAGCVALVYNSGGYTEIIDQGECGYLWSKRSELTSFTVKLMEDKSLFKRLSKNAKEKAKKFSYQQFKKEVSEIVR